MGIDKITPDEGMENVEGQSRHQEFVSRIQELTRSLESRSFASGLVTGAGSLFILYDIVNSAQKYMNGLDIQQPGRAAFIAGFTGCLYLLNKSMETVRTRIEDTLDELNEMNDEGDEEVGTE